MYLIFEYISKFIKFKNTFKYLELHIQSNEINQLSGKSKNNKFNVYISNYPK